MFRIIISCLLALPAFCYYPVLCLHGVTGNSGDCTALGNVLRQEHPNTTYVPLKFYENAFSLVGLQTQLEKLVTFVQKIIENDPVFNDGWIMVCHSQGALLCRSLTQYWSEHKIHTLVSLAGPQAGVYGVEFITDNVPFTKYLPGLVDLIENHIYQIFDSPLFNKYLSVADIWHDPYHESDYLSRNKYLPKMNNVIDHPDKTRFKQNFLKLQQAVFYTGDVGVKDLYDDGISPWQTGAWGYWDANKTMLNMTQTEIWKQDTIGLKKLDDAGRLHVQSVKNIRHNDWIRNESIIKQYVLPWLV